MCSLRTSLPSSADMLQWSLTCIVLPALSETHPAHGQKRCVRSGWGFRIPEVHSSATWLDGTIWAVERPHFPDCFVVFTSRNLWQTGFVLPMWQLKLSILFPCYTYRIQYKPLRRLNMDGFVCVLTVCSAHCIDEKTSEDWKDFVGPAEALCKKPVILAPPWGWSWDGSDGSFDLSRGQQ